MLIVLCFLMSVIVALILIVSLSSSRTETRRLTPEEERAFELHPVEWERV